jgi:tripartite-type tricarboxylate transporter receptor subunit TctC
MSAFASVATLIEGGKRCALAVTSPQRSPFKPNLPTAAEAGLPGFQIEF